MPTALLSVEIAVVVVLVLLAVFLATTYARRRVISRGAILFVPCGWRPNRRNRWRLGHLRLGNTRLEWFSLLGVSARPTARLGPRQCRPGVSARRPTF